MSRNQNIWSPSHCLQENGSLLKPVLLHIDTINQTSYVQTPFALMQNGFVKAPQVVHFSPKCNSVCRKDKTLLQGEEFLELSPRFLRI